MMGKGCLWLWLRSHDLFPGLTLGNEIIKGHLQKKNIYIYQLPQNCTGPTIHIGQEIQCLLYVGLFSSFYDF